MPRKRMTRMEGRETTRQRLLDAATISIAKKGLAATSVEDIVAEAGYTRGAFYSNFRSKSDLFIELLHLDHQRTQESLWKLLDAATSGENHQTQLVSLYEKCYPDDNRYIIWAEARLHAMRDERFRQLVNILYLEKRDMIARFIELSCMLPALLRPRSFADRAFAIMVMMDGTGYFNIAMPNDFPSTLAEALLSIDGLDGPVIAR